jgi:hypothetical protein
VDVSISALLLQIRLAYKLLMNSTINPESYAILHALITIYPVILVLTVSSEVRLNVNMDCMIERV